MDKDSAKQKSGKTSMKSMLFWGLGALAAGAYVVQNVSYRGAVTHIEKHSTSPHTVSQTLHTGDEMPLATASWSSGSTTTQALSPFLQSIIDPSTTALDPQETPEYVNPFSTDNDITNPLVILPSPSRALDSSEREPVLPAPQNPQNAPTSHVTSHNPLLLTPDNTSQSNASPSISPPNDIPATTPQPAIFPMPSPAPSSSEKEHSTPVAYPNATLADSLTTPTRDVFSPTQQNNALLLQPTTPPTPTPIFPLLLDAPPPSHAPTASSATNETKNTDLTKANHTPPIAQSPTASPKILDHEPVKEDKRETKSPPRADTHNNTAAAMGALSLSALAAATALSPRARAALQASRSSIAAGFFHISAALRGLQAPPTIPEPPPQEPQPAEHTPADPIAHAPVDSRSPYTKPPERIGFSPSPTPRYPRGYRTMETQAKPRNLAQFGQVAIRFSGDSAKEEPMRLSFAHRFAKDAYMQARKNPEMRNELTRHLAAAARKGYKEIILDSTRTNTVRITRDGQNRRAYMRLPAGGSPHLLKGLNALANAHAPQRLSIVRNNDEAKTLYASLMADPFRRTVATAYFRRLAQTHGIGRVILGSGKTGINGKTLHYNMRDFERDYQRFNASRATRAQAQRLQRPANKPLLQTQQLRRQRSSFSR
jgi:hypothetical protein